MTKEIDLDRAIEAAQRSCLAFIVGAAREGDRTDPKMVAAIAEVSKILAEVATTKEVLAERMKRNQPEA